MKGTTYGSLDGCNVEEPRFAHTFLPFLFYQRIVLGLAIVGTTLNVEQFEN